jgi:uncharacterized protein (DUF433 family)
MSKYAISKAVLVRSVTFVLAVLAFAVPASARYARAQLRVERERQNSSSLTMATAIASSHVRVDKSGSAWIDDTNVKVIEVILDHLAYGHSPEEIHLQHPHLLMAQVHPAFAYYFDHKTEIDAEIDRRHHRVEALRAKAAAPFTRKQLTARLKKR